MKAGLWISFALCVCVCSYNEVVIKKNDGKRISGVLRELLSNDDVILDVKKKVKNTKKYSIQEVAVSLKEIKETKLKINFK